MSLRLAKRTFSRWLAALGLLPQAILHAENLYIDYSPKPRLTQLTKPTLCILDPHAMVNFEASHAKGHRLLAYISLVELAKGSPADAVAQRRGVPFVGTNTAWDSHLLDVFSPAWSEFMLEDCAAKALAMGYDGLFLDTLDSVEHIAGRDIRRLERCHTAIVQLILKLRERHPGRPIIVNRGFALLPAIRSAIDGVLIESVSQSFDLTTKNYQPVSEDDAKWIKMQIHATQTLRLQVYAVDYVQPSQKQLATATAEHLRSLGCIPFVTTHGLTGEVLAPAP